MIQPLADFVLIEPDEVEEQTKSGIIIAKTEKEKPMYGTVVAVGPGKDLPNGGKSPMEVVPGDKIAFEKYGADDIEVDGHKYKILNQPRIFCKFE